MCEFAPGLGEYPLLKCDKECTSFLFMFANTCKWNMKCHRYNPPRIALYLYLNGCVVFDIPCVRFANYPSCVPVYGGFILARCVCSREGEMFWVWDSPLPSTARECGVASPPHRLCTCSKFRKSVIHLVPTHDGIIVIQSSQSVVHPLLPTATKFHIANHSGDIFLCDATSKFLSFGNKTS